MAPRPSSASKLPAGSVNNPRIPAHFIPERETRAVPGLSCREPLEGAHVARAYLLAASRSDLKSCPVPCSASSSETGAALAGGAFPMSWSWTVKALHVAG